MIKFGHHILRHGEIALFRNQAIFRWLSNLLWSNYTQESQLLKGCCFYISDEHISCWHGVITILQNFRILVFEDFNKARYNSYSCHMLLLPWADLIISNPMLLLNWCKKDDNFF